MYDVSEIGMLLHRVMQVVLIAPSNTCGRSAPTCKPRSPYPARLTPRCRRASGVALEAVSAHSMIGRRTRAAQRWVPLRLRFRAVAAGDDGACAARAACTHTEFPGLSS
jgi:hypothetical protein